MMKMTSFAGLALMALMALTGCNKVRKCTEGEVGCLKGAPKADGTCEAGLVAKGKLCVEDTSSGGGGGSCNCAVDEVCAEDGKTCLAYCALVDDLPQVQPTPPACKPARTPSDQNPMPYNFRTLCINACEQQCIRAQTLCPGYTCKLSDCSSDAQLALCNVDCPGLDVGTGETARACLTKKCTDLAGSTCEQFKCPAGSTKSCTDVRCTDTCGDNNADGYCDDGDPASAIYSFCPYGTDCTDCGPRKGARPDRAPIGAVCPGGQDVACAGYNDDFLKSNAWCLRVIDDQSAPYRCVPNCTTSDGAGTCPDDYECQAVTTSDGDPFTDAVNGTEGYACVPIVCDE